MVFYNGFNLMVDLLLVLIVWRLAARVGFLAGYRERDQEIQVEQDSWQDYYYEAQREMRD